MYLLNKLNKNHLDVMSADLIMGPRTQTTLIGPQKLGDILTN
jgi:hypothetical protein